MDKRDRVDCLVLKVDFERAYESVSWNYLRYMFNKMGFVIRWKIWKEACIFNSTMSVLGNGSSTDDFILGIRLRQRALYPLSSLFYLWKGLTCLMKKAVEIGDFRGFKVNEEVIMDILQFAKDTIIVGEGSWRNLWSFNSVLRGFE